MATPTKASTSSSLDADVHPGCSDAPSAAWGFPDPEVPTPAIPEATTNGTSFGSSATRKSRAGRRPGAVWAYFTPLRTEHNKTHATCRFCARRCAGVAARMAAHILTKCPAAPAHEVDALTAALAQEPPDKRQRVDVDSGLAAFATVGALAHDSGAGDSAARANDGVRRPLKDDALDVAMQKFLVACLRHNVPLALMDDAFFREALMALRPNSMATIKSAHAGALLERVGATVASEVTQWMRASKSFTLLYNATTREWRGVDSHHRSVLIAEDSGGLSAEWLSQLLSRLEIIGTNTVVGLCCHSAQVNQQVSVAIASAVETQTDSPLRRVALLSTCLLTETLRLWKLVTDAIPLLQSTVVEAAEFAQTYAELPTASLDQTLGSEAAQWTHLSSGWSMPFVLLKRLNARSDTLQQPEADAAVPTARAEFWRNVAPVTSLVAPFAWLFSMSESSSVGSSQFILAWLWLLTTIQSSSLSSAEERDALVKVGLEFLQRTLDDHHLVALLLDPRLRGIGLSPTGRRKVKTLVVQLARRIWGVKFESTEAAAHDPASPAPSARQALLTQLGHYIDKTAYFADEVAWEMARGAAPETFWRDYIQDAPELTALASAVLAFVPVIAQTSELLATANHVGESAERPPFETRQIRFHFERNRKRSDFEPTAVFTKHAELLSPLSVQQQQPPPPVPVAHSLPVAPTRPTQLVEAVSGEWIRLRSTASPASAENEPASSTVGLEASWLVFQTEEHRLEIEAALRNLVPPSLAANANASPCMS